MKKYQLLIWCLLIIGFLFNQFLERVLSVHIPFMYSYLDDLLAVPLTLCSYQLFVSLLSKNAHYHLPVSMVVICIIGFSFHFELLMPSISNRYTADLADVWMYMMGGIIYILTTNRLYIKILSQ